MRRFLVLMVLGLAACTKPADRITTALVDRGVPPKQAECMGDRLADRLDYGQLQRLNELSKIERRAGNMTLNQLLDELNRGGDPKLVAAVIRPVLA